MSLRCRFSPGKLSVSTVGNDGASPFNKKLSVPFELRMFALKRMPQAKVESQRDVANGFVDGVADIKANHKRLSPP